MKGQTNRSILGPKLQRRLRNAPTDAERNLWRHLKGRQLENCKFRRQHPFENYIADFVCLGFLVIELDGGQHTEAADFERTSRLKKFGFVVLRFWNNDVLLNTDGVMGAIRLAPEARAPSPPNPPLEGEG